MTHTHLSKAAALSEKSPVSVHPAPPLPGLIDGHGRTVRYLRVSVTDRCNLRCTYCRSGLETFIPHPNILRYEEILQLIDLAVRLGVEKVRLTGGEPFARKGFLSFLERLRAAHPSLDIRITTNGTLLNGAVSALKDLALNGVNLSLDTFDPLKFERITGRDLYDKVRRSLDELLSAGIPLKLNAVALRGINDDELPAFLDFAMRHPVDVRYIEFMPMGEGTRWSTSYFWPAQALLASARTLYTVQPIADTHSNNGPARLYSLTDKNGTPGLGHLGLITPLSSHFCKTCNRLRITSEGALRTCLFDDHEYSLRDVLRHPRLGLDHVRRILERATHDKPIGSERLACHNEAVAQRRMTAIGG